MILVKSTDKFSRVDSLSRVEGERVVTREVTVFLHVVEN